MRYLLDTHTVIWYLDESRRLPPRTEEIIDDNDNRIHVSAISLTADENIRKYGVPWIW